MEFQIAALRRLIRARGIVLMGRKERSLRGRIVEAVDKAAAGRFRDATIIQVAPEERQAQPKVDDQPLSRNSPRYSPDT